MHLFSILGRAPADYVSKDDPQTRIGAILGLGIAYAGRQAEGADIVFFNRPLWERGGWKGVGAPPAGQGGGSPLGFSSPPSLQPTIVAPRHRPALTAKSRPPAPPCPGATAWLQGEGGGCGAAAAAGDGHRSLNGGAAAVLMGAGRGALTCNCCSSAAPCNVRPPAAARVVASWHPLLWRCPPMMLAFPFTRCHFHRPPQVSSIAALSLGLIYQGTANGDAVEAVLQVRARRAASPLLCGRGSGAASGA